MIDDIILLLRLTLNGVTKCWSYRMRSDTFQFYCTVEIRASWCTWPWCHQISNEQSSSSVQQQHLSSHWSYMSDHCHQIQFSNICPHMLSTTEWDLWSYSRCAKSDDSVLLPVVRSNISLSGVLALIWFNIQSSFENQSACRVCAMVMWPWMKSMIMKRIIRSIQQTTISPFSLLLSSFSLPSPPSYNL